MAWRHPHRGQELERALRDERPGLFGDLLERVLRGVQEQFGANAPEDLLTYTPVLNQGAGAIVPVAGQSYGRYQKVGPWVHGEAHITFDVGTAGTAGQPIELTMPVAPFTFGDPFTQGTFIFLDSGTTYYVGAVSNWSATKFRFYTHGNGAQLGAIPAFGVAPADKISATFRYRWG